jgi:uncharacterized protein (TIGR02284 family)
MAESYPELVTVLNHLIQICTDAENGYRTAAGCIRNRDLRDLFEVQAHQRELFAIDLQNAIRELGHDPAASGSLVGALLRGWTNVKSLVMNCDELAMLNECRQNEELAEQAYRETLKQKLAPEIRAMLERQLARLEEALQRIQMLTNVIEQSRRTAVSRA